MSEIKMESTLKGRIQFLEEENKFKETLIRQLREDINILYSLVGETPKSSQECTSVLRNR